MKYKKFHRKKSVKKGNINWFYKHILYESYE
jgi:hypothetical protein